MSESTTLLLGLVAGGGLCALWAWLQLLNAVNTDNGDAARCGLDGCDVCRGVNQGVNHGVCRGTSPDSGRASETVTEDCRSGTRQLVRQ